jgi:hypothetical protein
LGLWLALAGVIAWLGYMTKMGSEATSRLIAAYYPLLVAGLMVLTSLDGRILRRRLLRSVGLLAMLSALPLVILCPARPLFPVGLVSALMTRVHVPTGIVTRYDEVYQVYAARADAFRDLLAALPASERTIGFVQAGDDSEVSLWRPFGSRKVVEVKPSDSVDSIRARGVHYVVVGQDALEVRYKTTLADILSNWSGTLVEQKEIILMAHEGAKTWYLIRL